VPIATTPSNMAVAVVLHIVCLMGTVRRAEGSKVD